MISGYYLKDISANHLKEYLEDLDITYTISCCPLDAISILPGKHLEGIWILYEGASGGPGYYLESIWLTSGYYLKVHLEDLDII